MTWRESKRDLSYAVPGQQWFLRQTVFQYLGRLHRAQSLHMAGVPISGPGQHGVAFVATNGDSVYAFEAQM